MAKGSSCFREKVAYVMKEHAHGKLHSGPGKKRLAKNRAQAAAIAYSEAGKKCGGRPPKKRK